MTPVFATRLSILADSRHDSESLFPAVVEVSKTWLRDKAKELGIPLELTEADAMTLVGTESSDHGRITWNDLVGETVQAWQAVLVQSLDAKADSSRRFSLRIELSVRKHEEEVSMTIRGLLNSRFDIIRPPSFVMRPPRLVRMLVDEFEAIAANSTKATYVPKFLEESEMEELITHILDYNRMAPVVVVTKTEDGKVMCEPNLLASELVGLGRVYVLPSAESSFQLTKALTKQLSVYGGAVRLYWPQFTVHDNPHSHPLWLADMLSLPSTVARLPEDILLRVTSASAVGIAADRQLLDLEQELIAARSQEAQQRLKLAQQRTRELEASASSSEEREESLKSQVSEYEELLEAADQSVALADARREEAEYKLHEEYEERLKRDALISSLQQQSSELPDVMSLIEEFEAINNLDGYLQFAKKFAPKNAIQFLPSCDDSAAKSPMTGNLAGCWKALSAVIKGAVLFHNDPSAKLQETMIEGVGLTLEQFKADVSTVSQKARKQDYEFRYIDSNGIERREYLGPHVSYGKGNRDKAPFVYWYVDLDTRQFIVGHVGAKLRDGTGGYSR